MFGQGLGQGLQTGLNHMLEQHFTQQQQKRESDALNKAFESLPEDAPFETKFKTLMSAPGVSNETKKFALGNLVDYEKIKATQAKEALERRTKEEEQRIKGDEGRIVREAYEKAGYEMPEYVPGTPADVYKDLAKEQRESPSKLKSKEVIARGDAILSNIDEMEKLIPYTGSTLIPGKSFGGGSRLFPKALENRSKFNSLRGMLMSFYRDMESKGNMPKSIFDSLMENLPDAEKPEAENKGRLEATRITINNWKREMAKIHEKPGKLSKEQPTKEEPKKTRELPEGYVRMRDSAGKLRGVHKSQVREKLNERWTQA